MLLANAREFHSTVTWGFVMEIPAATGIHNSVRVNPMASHVRVKDGPSPNNSYVLQKRVQYVNTREGFLLCLLHNF